MRKKIITNTHLKIRNFKQKTVTYPQIVHKLWISVNIIIKNYVKWITLFFEKIIKNLLD